MQVRIKNFNELGWPLKLRHEWPELTSEMHEYIGKVYDIDPNFIREGLIGEGQYIKIRGWNWNVKWLEVLTEKEI